MKTLSAIFLAIGFVGTAQSAEQKIATIDMRKCYTEYWKTKKGIEALRQKRLGKDREVKEMVDERQKEIVAHQKMIKQFQDPQLGEAERERFQKVMARKLQVIKEIEQAIQQFERATNTELQGDQRKLTQTIVDEIRGLVAAKAKERSYTFVLDSSAIVPTQLVIVYNAGDDDLTKEIQDQLEATNPEKAVKSPDKPVAPKK